MGIPFADPAKLFDAVKSFPDVVFVVAHAGTDLLNTQAILLAQTFENVYLEPSWCSTVTLAVMKAKLGPARLMFSSDTLNNTEAELAKWRYVFKDDADLEQVFHKTAEEAFGLK